MEEKNSIIAVFVVIILVAVAIMSIYSGVFSGNPGMPYESQVKASEDIPSYLFVQIAESGEWNLIDEEEKIYRLVLINAAPQTLMFTDRPDRNAGHLSTGEFLKIVDFSNPPNAALEILDGENGHDVIVVELLCSSWDYQNKILTYNAKILPAVNGSLSQYHERMESGIPATFNDVSLYIDNIYRDGKLLA